MHRSKSGSKPENRNSIPEASAASEKSSYNKQLIQKTVNIRKNIRESLGTRIGGGIGSNELDTPIYIHGCIGKSKQLKVMYISNKFIFNTMEFRIKSKKFIS